MEADEAAKRRRKDLKGAAEGRFGGNRCGRRSIRETEGRFGCRLGGRRPILKPMRLKGGSRKAEVAIRRWKAQRKGLRRPICVHGWRSERRLGNEIVRSIGFGRRKVSKDQFNVAGKISSGTDNRLYEWRKVASSAWRASWIEITEGVRRLE